MQKIHLNKPLDWHPDAKDLHLLAQAGIVFTEPNAEGHYQTVEAHLPLTEIARRLAEMPGRLVQAFGYAAFEDTPLAILPGAAEGFYHIGLQKDFKKNGGWPYLDTKPFSKELAPLILQEVEHLSHRLHAFGIDDVQVGLELETTMPEFPIGTGLEGISTHWQEAKTQALRDLPPGPKRDAVAKFNAREMLMYEIVELDPRTRDIVEPIFGTQREGGYYDGQNTLELQLKHTPPSLQIENRKLLTQALYEKATAYNLPLDPPQYHVNLSFWRAGKNLFDADNPEMHTAGKAAIEGMTCVLADAFPTLIAGDLLKKEFPMTMAAETGRGGFFRLATGRAEIRPTQHGAEQDPDFLLVLGMAGALCGIEAVQSDLVSARKIERGRFARITGTKVLGHTLAGAVVNEDGSLEVSEAYLNASAEAIAQELGILGEDYQSKKHSMFREKPEFLPFIVSFFKEIRITQDGIRWPDTGGAIPPGAQHPVDLKRLQESIVCTEKLEGYIVEPGYDLNGTDDVQPDRRVDTLVHARMKRFKESRALAQTLTSPFRAALGAALETAFGVPQAAPEEVRALHATLATAKWENIRGDKWRATIPTTKTGKEAERAFNQLMYDVFGPENFDGFTTGGGAQLNVFLPHHAVDKIRSTVPPKARLLRENGKVTPTPSRPARPA